MSKLQEPKGIGFFSIKSGDVHYAKSEAQVQAYINSSDMGINASRGQDYGWRLEASWVKKVKKFKSDGVAMERLADKNGGKAPTTPQILYTIYGQELRTYHQRKQDEENPFEEQYLQDISGKPRTDAEEVTAPDETEKTKPATKPKK